MQRDDGARGGMIRVADVLRRRRPLGVTVLVSASLCLLSFASNARAAGPPFGQCPTVGQDASCQLLITVTDTGQSFQTDASQPPYEGDDDALIGVQNNSTHMIGSLQLSASGVFNFEGDGICQPANWPVSGGLTPPGCPPAFNVGPAGYMPNGYEGPQTWFSGFAGGSSGTVNFNPPLAPGGWAYFSLESPPTGQSIVVGAADSLSTNLSGGGVSSASIDVPPGTPVSDQATLAGSNAGGATGTVTYSVYSDGACTNLVAGAGQFPVNGPAFPPSNALNLAPGTYYWQASYSGDMNNQPAVSTCTSEVQTVGQVPANLCPLTLTGGGTFEPTQGVWQDDSPLPPGTGFNDRAGKQLRIVSATQAVAELDMVADRDTLLFGTRPLANRTTIVVHGVSTGTTAVPVSLRFKLSNAAQQQVLYDSPAVPVPLGPPCVANHQFAVPVAAPLGLPAAPAAPFKFVFPGPYSITAIGVVDHQELPQLQSEVSGQVVRTESPTFEFLPVTLTQGGAVTQPQFISLIVNTARMALEVHQHFSDYLPIPTGVVGTYIGPYASVDLTVPPNLLHFVSMAFQIAHVPRQFGTRGAAFDTLVNDLALVTDYYHTYARTIVVMRASDFAAVQWLDAAGNMQNLAGAQAVTPTAKVIFVKEDSAHFTVAHEFSHSLNYLWSDSQMLAECGVDFHNDDVRVAPPAPGNVPNANLYAHGFQITNGGATVARAFRDPLASIMESTAETDPQWIDQCTYWHDLRLLQRLVDPPVILVQGVLAINGRHIAGSFLPAYELNSQSDTPAPGGSVAIVLRGASGRILERFPFTPFGYDDPRRIPPVVPFSLRIPAVSGVHEIELVGPHGVLARLTMSRHAPSLSLRLTTRRKHRMTNVTVTWVGRADAGRQLTYTLLDSVDGGRNWSPLFVQRSYRGALLTFKRGTRLVLRLIATDGSRSTSRSIRRAL